MIDLGSGIAIAGVCISGGAVAITAIRVFAVRPGSGLDRKHSLTCAEHSGMLESLRGIKETQARQEKWLSTISGDIKAILKNGR